MRSAALLPLFSSLSRPSAADATNASPGARSPPSRCARASRDSITISAPVTGGLWLNGPGTYTWLIEQITTASRSPDDERTGDADAGWSNMSDDEVRAVAAYVWAITGPRQPVRPQRRRRAGHLQDDHRREARIQSAQCPVLGVDNPRLSVGDDHHFIVDRLHSRRTPRCFEGHKVALGNGIPAQETLASLKQIVGRDTSQAARQSMAWSIKRNVSTA